MNEYPDCPVCGCKLGFAFYTWRKLKTYGGAAKEYQIPVCMCGDKTCSFGFVRVLPDIMTPHKHYSTEVIENVVDEICTPETPQTEDYPCE
ncbi:DUF6431 domain-containing protein, partial [Ralstonia pseudosolanacearum]|uniref:DUF6431 domain-containing protein n=1 Tax=Ralstonia pseudosolanacearum TaxID=1310165 RepID=UPI003D178C27